MFKDIASKGKLTLMMHLKCKNGSNTACSLLTEPHGYTAKNPLNMNLSSIWFAIRFETTERADRVAQCHCVPPYTVLWGAAAWHPLTSTPTFLPMTMEVKQASRIKMFLCYNLALWYSVKVELNPEDKRNKPSPPSMQPHPLVNQQRISQCPHHSLRNWLIRWNSPGSLHWNSAEDARNTDLLRARVSATQQGDDWLDCECAASWCHLLNEINIW